MAKITVIILIVFAIIWQGCRTQKRIYQKDFDINGVTEMIELKDTITALVLGYSPAFECNDTTYSFSECFCINSKTDEIYKVWTECNTDTTFRKGDTIKVIPHNPKNENQKNISFNAIFIKENREYKYSPLYKLQVKTTYGTLVKL